MTTFEGWVGLPYIMILDEIGDHSPFPWILIALYCAQYGIPDETAVLTITLDNK